MVHLPLFILASVAVADAPEHAIVEATALLEDATSVTIPAPPPDCVGLVTIATPLESCPADAQGDGTYPGLLDIAASDGRCGLVCDPGEDNAQWYFAISAKGFSGAATCRLGGPDDPMMTVVYDRGTRTVPAEAGVIWLDHLGAFGFAEPERPGASLVLSAENRCPGGQARR